MNIRFYQHFTSESFVEDDFFRRWVIQPDSETNAFWKKFCQQYPEKKEELETAKLLLLSIHQNYASDIKKISKQQTKDSFQKVAHEMRQTNKVVKMPRRNWMVWTMAACIALFLSVGTFFHFQTKDTPLTFSTGNGQLLPVTLPDGSKVQLNANTTLSYSPKNWKDKEERQVWLKGEAFFNVEKKAQGTKFIVHAGDMKVAVLGTQFNVRSREEKAEVVLEEGKVELAIEAQKIIMKPGDLVSYSVAERKVATRKVKTADYVAWKDGITVFNDKLKDVVKELEILYGVQFLIKNKNLEERIIQLSVCLLYTSPSPRDATLSRMPSSA